MHRITTVCTYTGDNQVEQERILHTVSNDCLRALKAAVFIAPFWYSVSIILDCQRKMKVTIH